MELAEIVRRYRGELDQSQLLPSHIKALDSIESCRTPAQGEVVAICPCCRRIQTFYVSCGNRNCPKCQNNESTKWLERQREKLLPVDYFMITFTLPSELRQLAYHQQKEVYALLFKASSEALKELVGSPRILGGEIGMTGVLHTHSRRLDFHPHIHYIVPAGALLDKKTKWKKATSSFLVHGKPLGRLFRGKVLSELKEKKWLFPKKLYRRDWVVDVENVGQGEFALQYLSRYLYRGVISEKNILSDQNGEVTFRYTDSKTKEEKIRTLPGADFLSLLLKHVLPKGFRRIRDFGYLHSNARKALLMIQFIFKVIIAKRSNVEKPKIHCAVCKKPMKTILIIRPWGIIYPNSRGSPLI